MAYTYSKIATVTIGSGGSSSINFLAIPQNYTDLVIKISARKANNDYDIQMKFNSSTSGYSSKYLESNGTAASVGGYSAQSSSWAANASTNNQTANIFGNSEIYIPNYTSGNYKNWGADVVNENNATAAVADLLSGLWSNSAAINSIELNANGSTFVQYSSATLYGIKAEV